MEYYQIENGVLVRYTGREESIQVPDGIHTVGEGAFKGCVSLKKVVLPRGLTCIMGDAFKGCRKLEEVVIPEGVTSIGRYAFHRCHALRQVILPLSVEELGECAFLYCDSMREAQLPGVKRMGMAALANGISLERLMISQELDTECLCDVFTGCGRVREISCVRSDGGRSVISVETYRIPNVVEVVAGAFYVPPLVELVVRDILERMMELEGRTLVRFRVNIKHMEVPEGIEVLAKSSFYDMRGIVDIRLPKSLRYIESRAFRNCIGLEQVTFGGSDVQIDEDAFRNCTSLKSVRTCDGAEYMFHGLNDIYKIRAGHSDQQEGTIQTGTIQTGMECYSGHFDTAVPELVRVVHRQVLGNFRVSGTILLQYLGAESRVVIPEGITRIAEEAFAGIETIDKVLLPESLREIGAEAFRGCLLMQTVTLPGGLCRIGAGAFEDCVKLLRIEIPAQVEVLENRTFRHCRALQEVRLPEGLYRVGESAFYGCSGLKKIQLPKSLTFIGKMAFYKSGLREVRIPAGTETVESLAFAKAGLQKVWISGGHNTGKQYGTDVFGGCVKLKMLVLEEGVCHIPDKLAYGCVALERVVLPKTLESVGRHVLEGTAFLEQWKRRVSGALAAEEAIVWDGQHLADEDSQRLPAFLPPCNEGGTLAVGSPHHAREVWEGDILWDGQHLAGEVRIPETVKIIAGGAFYGNTQITEVHLLAQVQSVGAAAFKGCKLLRRVWFPSNIMRLEEEVFSGCVELEEVLLTQETEERAFSYGVEQGEVLLTQGLYERAFSSGVGLEKVPPSQELKEYAAAREHTAVKQAEQDRIPRWRSIGERAFYRCGKLREVCLEQVEELGREALYGCTALVPGAVNPALRAGEGAFADTVQGEWLENGLHVVGNLVISGALCAGEVILPENVQGIAPYAFAGNHVVSKVIFPEKIYWIGEGAFFGCSSLECVVLPAEQCLPDLKHTFEDGKLQLPAYQSEGTNLLKIDANAFEKCSSLKEVFCPAQQVGASAFAGCVSLVRAELPQIRVLEKRLFAGCVCLETCLCEKAQVVGAYCFSGCKSLQDIDLASMNQIGEYTFEGCESLQYAEFQDGTLLMAHALEDCCGLEKICLSGQRSEIGLKEYALSGCTSLRQVVYLGKEWRFGCYADILSQEIPEMVRLLFHSAFSCFTVEQEEKLVRYRGAASLVRIPEGIRRIGAEIFRDAMLLEQVEIPESVEYIGARAFHGTRWLTDRRKENPLVMVRDMLLDGSASVGEVVIPEGIHLVCGWAFANGLDITSIRFPAIGEDLKNGLFQGSRHKYVQVEEYAFRNCINLRKMILPDGEVVQFTGLADRERELPPLAKQAVMDSLNCFKNDENDVLRECTGNISRIRLAQGITEIGEGAFQDGNLLTTVTFPDTVTKIGARAFAGCKWLREVRQADSVVSIGAHAFFGCGILSHVQFSENLRQIGAHAFENCTALEEILIPEGVEEIPERAFYRCHNLKEIRLPSTLKTIGREAFAFCGGASGIQVPEGVQVGERAFYGD